MRIEKTNSKRLLWAAMAASLPGMSGCYSDRSAASMSLRPAATQDIIASNSYDAATRSFNPKWPYGQESQ